MALEYGPFNGLENAWDAYDFAEYLKLFFGNGVFPNPSNNLQILAHENMQTKVSVGVGFIQGHKIKNTSEFILQHDIADGVLKRIDRVVMRANFLENKGEIIVKRGTPASSPVAPTLVRDTDYYELALADVFINNGATVITQANITDQRLNATLCGIVATNITQLDTTTLFNQYQSWIEQQKSLYESELATWTEQQKREFEEWQTLHENDFDTWMAQEQQDFETWFATLQELLDENVAATLTAKVQALEVDKANKTDLVNISDSVNDLNTALATHLDEDALIKHKARQISVINPETQVVQNMQTFAETLFTDVSNGKQLIGTAITDVDASIIVPSEPTFAQLASAINGIVTGKKWASGTVTSSNATQTFTHAYGSGVKSKYSVNVSGLTFTPTRIIINSLTSDDISILLIDGFLTPNLVICVPSITTGTSGTATIDYFKGSTSPANVSATNFNLPVNLQNHNYRWIAFG